MSLGPSQHEFLLLKHSSSKLCFSSPSLCLAVGGLFSPSAWSQQPCPAGARSSATARPALSSGRSRRNSSWGGDGKANEGACCDVARSARSCKQAPTARSEDVHLKEQEAHGGTGAGRGRLTASWVCSLRLVFFFEVLLSFFLLKE